MCGIVGLHIRETSLYPQLGCLLTGMLSGVAERGPDSAGVAIYGDPRLTPPGHSSASILSAGQRAQDVQARLAAILGADGVAVFDLGPTLVVNAPVESEALCEAVHAALPSATIIGFGEGLAVLKGVGHPRSLAQAFGLAGLQGWQGVAHARMATESAVTPLHSHPFSVGPDQCLVHNGSFSNHATIRRELIAAGACFDSDNDSEVAARFIAAELEEGTDLEKALRLLCDRFDGFYTLLVSTEDCFAVVRDAIACKPAVVAETPEWVAMASEYRALASLPGISSARIFEPEPAEVYVWRR